MLAAHISITPPSSDTNLNNLGSGIVLGTERLILNGESLPIYDSSSNHWTMTNSNVTVTSTAPTPIRGAATMAFNGTSSVVHTPMSSSLFLSSSADWTMDFFIMVPTGGLTNNGVLFTNANGITGTWNNINFTMYQMTNGQYQFEYSNGTTPVATGAIGTALIASNVWRHYAITYTSSTKVLRCYVNGVLDTTTTLTTFSAPATVPRITVGRNDLIIGTPTFYFKGWIERVRMTPSVRWTANFIPDSDPDPNFSSVALLLHGNGAAAAITTANAVTTVIDNSPTPKVPNAVTGSPAINVTRSKWGGSSINFPGNARLAYAAGVTDFDLYAGNFTIEGWVYYSTNATNPNVYRIISYQSSNVQGGYSYYIDLTSTGQIKASVQNGTATFSATTTGGATLNAWNHFAMVRNGSSIVSYINGAPSTATTITGVNSLTSPRLYIGSDMDGTFSYNGFLDDIRITKGVARYTAAFTPAIEEFSNNS